MTASLTICFTDGSSKTFSLGETCIELDLPAGRPQSIGLNQTAKGGLKLSFTKGLMDGKKWNLITISKQPE